MKPQLLSSGVSLWSLLVFSVLKSSHAVCVGRECYSNETESLTATTTTISFVSRPNCTLSVGDNITGNGSITGLSPGTVHQLFLSCLNCCKEITMKPGTIGQPIVTSTTSSISLHWAPPPGEVFMYRLWHSGAASVTKNTSDTFAVLSDLNSGTEYTITVTAIAADNKTQGDPRTLTQFTKPERVHSLSVTDITTSSMVVTWTEPQGSRSFYRLLCNDGTRTRSFIVNDTMINVTGLTAGVEHRLTITAVAGDNQTESEMTQVFHHTEPARIRNPRVTNVTVSSVSLNWSEPLGHWSFYSVNWTDGRINVSDAHVTINNLNAGVEYAISVTAVAGDGHTGGQSVTLYQYTKPERVHSLRVTDITTSSMLVTWTEPQGSRSFYRLLWTDGTRSQGVIVYATLINVTGLTAGVEHRLTVTAVAGDNQTESEMTDIFHYTNPNPVSSIEALPKSTTSVNVKWSYPPGAQSYYQYLISTYNATGTILNSTTIQDNNTDVLHLLPGVKYNISVKTIAAPGSESREKWTQSYTMPGAVTDLTVSDMNTTAIQLTWLRPSDYKTSYSYLLVALQSAAEMQRNQTEWETFTFIDLNPGELYTFHVFTVVEGVKSTGINMSRYTMPNPPGPIAVDSQTVQSINFTWPIPDDVNRGLYNFSVSTIYGVFVIKDNWFLLGNLESGSPYNISVVTVGAWNSKSTAVSAQNYTRPFPVTNLRQTDITTDAVTLLWEQPQSKPHYSYVVQYSNGSSHSKVVADNTSTITELLSGSNYSFTVTTQTADGTQAAPVTASFFTRPYSVKQLAFEHLNTTTIHLVWSKPLQYKSEYQYRVQTTGCGSHNKTVREEAAQISELTPGTNCTLCVFVIAVNGIEGDANCISQHTHPESVQPSMSSQGSNSSVLVSWSRPAGNVEYFQVYLNSTSSSLRHSSQLNSTSTSFLFEDLSAGTLYTARVITHSGPLNLSSGFITNATFPNPPGSIEVLTKTTSTIELRWEEAPLMTGASFFYKLTHTPSQGNGSVSTTNTSHTLDSLISGTPYNLSVVTVGVMDFESEKVHSYMVTTRPYSVEQLAFEHLNTTTIHLVWSKPLQYKSEYQYRVQTTGCGSHNKTVKEEAAQISELTPGTNCTLCVFVIAVNGIEGDANCISQHTHPESVQPSMSSQGSNSSVLVSWSRPAGNVEYFQVYLNSTSSSLRHSSQLNSTSTSFLFEDLSAGTLYTARVITHSGPLNLSSGFITNATFPNPPGSIEVLTKTTSTIELRWEEAPLMTGASFFYKLTHTPSQGNGSVSTTNTSHTLDSLISGTPYNLSIVTVGAMDFESEKVHSYMVTTRPYSVEQLAFEHLNTTTIHLVWSKPLQYKSEYQYRVQTTGCGSHNKTVREEAAQISELTPGTNCTLCVFVIAVNGIEGDANCISQHTQPESVQPSISSQGSNSSVLVSWSRPAGNVEYFQVYLNSTSSSLRHSSQLNSTSTSFLFEDLSAGTLYTARVITDSGPLNLSSGFITNATFPNPPGSIEVLTKTTSTIEIRWEEAPLMTGASFFYKLTHTPSQGNGSVSTTNTSHTLDSLISGTPYNLSIVTVGAMDFESEKVHSYMVTTRPYSVEQLAFEHLNTTTIHLVWSKPLQYKSEYQYRVQTTGCGFHNKTVREEAAQISELTPGTNCTLCVFVIAVNGIEGDANCITQHTYPESVQPSISSQGSNSSVLVSWSRPAGNVEYFQVYLNSTSSSLRHSSQLNSTSTSFLFEDLSAGTLYTARVITHSGPLNLSSGFITNATFPNPPGSIEVLTKTSSTIEIRWEEAPLMTGASFFYKLTHTPSQGTGSVSTTNTSHTLDSLISGTPYNLSIVTVGVMDFESEKVHSYMVTTRPYSIQSLSAQTLNTTTVHLFWSKPLQYKDEYKYRVQTTGCGSANKTVREEAAQISELTPGTNCTLCVFVIAVNGIEGDANCMLQYTKPESVQPSISSQGSNSSVLVSWSRPAGNVEYFQVYLNSTSSSLSHSSQLNSTSTSFLFEDLSAGTLYTARVITHSGPFNASSGFITNATFPNPPGSIEVFTKTTSTIEIRWEEAPLMTGVSFSYKLTHTPSQGNGSVSTPNTSHTLDSLISGVSYNISIVTVGAMGFQSTEVHLSMVTTRKLDVGSVVAREAEEENITVTWEKPGDYQGRYHYLLMWQSRDGLRNITTNQTEYTIYDLDPGSRYNYSVTPEIFMGSHGVTTWNSSCTNAGPVKNLTCEGLNRPKAEIILSWTKPRGGNSGFQVTVNNSKITSSFLNVTVSKLRHNTKYELTVVTLSCGQPSSPVSLDCWTGITDPPIPPDYETFLDVVGKEHNKFSIQINRELLDNSNGRVKHVGVLMTKKPPDNTSNWRTYLGNTYDQWKAEETQVYLATVIETNHQLRSAENHLSIEIGDGSEWEGYTNGPLDSGIYQYAIVLFTRLNLQNGLVNYQESLVSTTNFYPAIELPSDPVIIGIAVGTTMGIFSVLFIILIGFIIYWKRMNKKDTSEIEFQSMRSKASISVRIEDYEAYFKKQRADSNCGFAEEFEDLKLVGTGQARTSALTMENKSKNRYNNVLPYDCSRVKLSIIHGSPFDDYINANYMPGFNSRKEFIAAQGPLPATVGEFWRMMWEKNVQTLVMLTRCNEQGRVKCEQYWGPGTKHFENITVTTTSEIALEDWTIREFEIKNVKTMETRTVRQFHFTAWPDHGVPETTELLISFRHLVREHMDQYSKNSPTVVHCSAGVGRTGTFIAIDTLIFQIERENAVDIYGTVHELRMHRTLMVQTEDQYVFLNKCAMDIIKSRTGTNVDLIYQNAAAFSIYENIDPRNGPSKNGYYNN